MRILFVCSGLAAGRDGVGDHVRRLAQECARQGHTAALLALHDRELDAGEAETEETGGVRCLRLGAQPGWRAREQMVRATAFRREFEADWVSFHFVPYGYDDRGLPGGLGRAVRELAGEARLHFMFHELWIGAAEGSSWRHRFTGTRQRMLIRRMLAQAGPKLVTTTIPVYAALLNELGLQAQVLPLFGNILPAPSRTRAELLPELEAPAEAWRVGLFFGAIHPEWKPEPLFSALLRTGQKIALVQAGHAGGPGEETWRRVEKEYAGRLQLIRRGGQPAEQISALMQAADFAIATSPWQLIGKSSSVATMVEHGLPVLVTRDDYRVARLPAAPPTMEKQLQLFREEQGDEILRGLIREAPRSRLPEIARQFTRLLEETA
jgi:hypothetical protein